MSFLQSETLLRYLYRELPVNEHDAFFHSLENDNMLQSELNDLKEGIKVLSGISFIPEQRSIDRIIAYAHS